MGNMSYCGMITYTVHASANQRGFHVKIAGSEGNRQTILGFGTEGAADAWIADDKRLTDHTALWNHPIGSAAQSESRSQQIEAHCSAVARSRS
jgi:hypothetical protein